MFKFLTKAQENDQAEERVVRALLEQELKDRLVVPTEMPVPARLAPGPEHAN